MRGIACNTTKTQVIEIMNRESYPLQVPTVIRKLVGFLETKLDTEGIFRLPGANEETLMLQQMIDTGIFFLSPSLSPFSFSFPLYNFPIHSLLPSSPSPFPFLLLLPPSLFASPCLSLSPSPYTTSQFNPSFFLLSSPSLSFSLPLLPLQLPNLFPSSPSLLVPSPSCCPQITLLPFLHLPVL